MLYARKTYDGFVYEVTRTGDLFLVTVLSGQRQIGRCKGALVDAHLNGAVVKAMALGAVFTEPEYRRRGIAGNCFRVLDSIMQEQGVLVSYLHPFSFAAYRAMGYERVADHRELTFPIDRLDFLPVCTDLQRCACADGAEDLIEAYHRFCKNRNILFRRDGAVTTLEPANMAAYMYGKHYEYGCKDIRYFVSHDTQAQPDGYVMLHLEQQEKEHHLFGTLHVDELCFDSPATVRKLLGFLRTYQGEADTVIIHNCAMATEVEKVLQHYKYTQIRVIPDLSARIHNVPALLAAVSYPNEKGSFTVRVTDCPKSPFCKNHTEGTWQVSYKNGDAAVTRLEDDAPWDISAPMPAFTQLIHGYESQGAQTARYLEGVKLKNDCADFFRAFPWRPNGLFELF